MGWLTELIKQRMAGFLQWHVTNPVNEMQRELVYQKIFDNQCANRGCKNDFYPIGAAASYGLMYFLFRVLAEHELHSIVEFGSGQSTLLIDRLKQAGTRHICYENDPLWHGLLAPRLKDCDYRLRPLTDVVVDGSTAQWYSNVDPEDCEMVLIDGPSGTPRFSRFGCVNFLKALRKPDILIIFDDTARPGERDTVAHTIEVLKSSGRTFRINELQARTTQTIIASGRFIGATYYY